MLGQATLSEAIVIVALSSFALALDLAFQLNEKEVINGVEWFAEPFNTVGVA